MRDRHEEAAGIWIAHGPADAITTIVATRRVGIAKEANPIIRQLLEIGDLPAVVFMLGLATIAAVLWPKAADSVDLPRSAAIIYAAPAILIVIANLWVAL